MDRLTNTNIPDDLILEILLRLPVKTLSQFKCVCKHWYALIHSRGFINQHFNHKSNQERLLIRNYRPDLERYSFSLYVDDILSKYEEPNHLQIPFMASALMGPLNGVFCVVSLSAHLALLNPATRQFKPIPLPRPNVQTYLSLCDNSLGFGLNPLSSDYKVVSINYYWNEVVDSPHYPCLISVYTSGSNTWRHFEDPGLVNSSGCSCRSLCNTYLNGFYYWVMDNETDAVILAFDMISEKFRQIKVPDCIKSEEVDLALYRDSLALVTCESDKVDKCVDLWALGNDGCWSKCLTMGPFQDIRWPLGFWKDGELLLETEDSMLTVYNVYNRGLRNVEAQRKENGFFIYWVYCYKESLVSIKGEGDRCKLWDISSDFVKSFFDTSPC
ncbi:hypothetical protein CASFOL_032997 [Castilleja foliolosa]|uniref:F-box domain-containing protein n=1 Tax=Castilleja foliolosa TaxID=1961234 RepID=A0ABD3C474_9LAMI